MSLLEIKLTPIFIIILTACCLVMLDLSISSNSSLARKMLFDDSVKVESCEPVVVIKHIDMTKPRRNVTVYINGWDKYYSENLDVGADWIVTLKEFCPELLPYFSYINGNLDPFKKQWKYADVYYIEFRLERVPKRTWANSGNKPWIYFSHEPPHISTYYGKYTQPVREHALRNSFNYTATYSINSNFPWPYWTYTSLINRWIGEENFYISEDTSFFNDKPKNFLSIVSNCKKHLTHQYRIKTLMQLKKYMGSEMDFLGYCGTDSGGKKDWAVDSTRDQFKFFAAFENSICPDYVTEKIIKPIQANSVPVVAGQTRREYEKLLPGSAFIHADDYISLEELAEDLIAISKDKNRYDKFFDWRRSDRAKSEVANRNSFIRNILGPTLNRECSFIDWITTKGNLEREHHVDVITEFSDPRHCQPVHH